MTQRGNGEGEVFGLQPEELLASDAFLDSLSRGVDPTGGQDKLAELFLDMHELVNAPIPAAPKLFDDSQIQASNESASEVLPPVSSLDARREKKRSIMGGFKAGLVGAAAATLLIAGGGGAIYNASPGSPLWGAKNALFGQSTAMVDLASTLEEANDLSRRGDHEGAMRLLQQARELADATSNKERAEARKAIEEYERKTKEANQVSTSVVTTSVTGSASASPNEPSESAPIQATTTIVEPAPASTVTVTVTIPVPVPVPGGTLTPDPSDDSTSTKTTTPTTTSVSTHPGNGNGNDK